MRCNSQRCLVVYRVYIHYPSVSLDVMETIVLHDDIQHDCLVTSSSKSSIFIFVSLVFFGQVGLNKLESQCSQHTYFYL